MALQYDEMTTRLSPFEDAAIDGWFASREQDAVLSTSELEALVHILRPGTPIEIWNGKEFVPLLVNMLNVGEKSGKISLGNPD